MDDNKRIAAITAVLAAIEAQGAGTAAAAAGQPGIAQRLSTGGGSAPSPWALYGRQRIMNMRAAMQRRSSARRA